MDSPMADIKIGKIISQWAESHNIFASYHPQISSTSDLAKNEAFSDKLLEESLCLYITDHQTAGRGRGTHSWTDASPGSSVLISWSFQLQVYPQPTTSCLIGLALYRACSATWPFLPWSLKAPNDIYLGDKKFAGILLENVAQGSDVRLIIGLGCNITAAPSDLKTSTSLLKSLPPGAPLLGQDFLSFMDRLLFEIMDAVSKCHEALSTTDRHSLLHALNTLPLLKEKYTSVEADGSLILNDKKTSWMTL